LSASDATGMFKAAMLRLDEARPSPDESREEN
jgi:hypothetical protein